MSLFKRCLLIFFWIAMMARPVYSDGLRQCLQHAELSTEVVYNAGAGKTVPVSFTSLEIKTTGGFKYDLLRTYELIYDP